MRHVFKVFVVTAILGLVTPVDAGAQSREQNASARRLFLAGRDLLDDGSFKEAETKFREALIRYPRAEQSDRTAYYLITTLVKQGRPADALVEIDAFSRNFPHSSWLSDVQEKRIALVGVSRPSQWPFSVQSPPPNKQGAQFVEKLDLVLRKDLPLVLHSAQTSLRQEIFRVLIEKDADQGIQLIRERFQADPADPAVISNFPMIAESNSPRALSFLISVVGSPANPNVRNQAIYWLGRREIDANVFATTLMEIFAGNADKQVDVAVSEILARLKPADRKATFDRILRSEKPSPLSIMERIYRSAGNVQLRTQVLQAVGQSHEPGARPFLAEVAKTEKNIVIRRSAAQALSTRKP